MKKFRLNIIAFTAIKVVLNTMHRMVYPYLGVFRDGLGVSFPMLSMAITLRSAIGAIGPFLATIGDSHGRKKGMLVGISIFTFGAGLVIIWPTFIAFVLALLLTLLGKYVFDPSMQAYLGDHISYNKRGRILAIVEFGWSLSFIIGVPIVGWLILRNGWRGPFIIAFILGFLMFATLAIILPSDPNQPDEKSPIFQNLRKLVKYKPAIIGLFMSLMMSTSNEVVNLVFGVWMEDSFGLRIAALGAASAVIGLSELGGESLVAVAVDRIGKIRAVILGLVFNSLTAMLLPFAAQNATGAVVGLFFLYITFEFTLVSSIPLMSEVYPFARATIMATNAASLSLGRALGALFATLLYTSFGFSANCFLAIGFNLVALIAVTWLSKNTSLSD